MQNGYFFSKDICNFISENKQALVLLPEIFLTNEFKIRFYDFFGFEPAIWHSKITPKNKRIIWNGIVKNNIKAPLLIKQYFNQGIMEISDLGKTSLIDLINKNVLI